VTSANGIGIRDIFKLVLEVLIVIPIGSYTASRAKQVKYQSSNLIQRGFILGATIGFCIEVGQLFLFSGVAQGLSVLTRAVGVAAGAALYVYRKQIPSEWLSSLSSQYEVRRYCRILIPVYVLCLFVAQNFHWFAWTSFDHALQQFDQLHFLPFYYHYYTSETVDSDQLVLYRSDVCAYRHVCLCIGGES